MLNKTKGREREREAPRRGKRSPFNEDCLRWRPPRRRDGYSRCNALESVVCAHGWMPTKDVTLCSAALQRDVMWVMYMEPICSAPQRAAMQVRRTDQVPLPTCIHSFVECGTVGLKCHTPLHRN